ncbi:MAG TPA: hypothetical protein VGW34_12250 [Allosphingosinicella sp.]|nr:hypothetical protein [Allosphingosinicella sp.]
MLFSKPGRITGALVAAAICVSSTSVQAASAAACQAGQTNCVLPVTDPAEAVAPPADTGVVVETEAETKTIGWLPIALGLALLAILVFVVLDGGDDEELSPI